MCCVHDVVLGGGQRHCTVCGEGGVGSANGLSMGREAFAVDLGV